MESFIALHGRPLRVRASKTAQRELAKLTAPLLAEIDLIFGCMVAKRVWFREEMVKDAVAAHDGLWVCFRSVRYRKTCSLRDIDDGAEAEEFPMTADKKHFVPDWLDIDYRKGKWIGSFGYDRAVAQENLQQGVNGLLVSS